MDNRLHVALPQDLYDQLKQVADEEQRSMAAVVRLALQDRLARQEAA